MSTCADVGCFIESKTSEVQTSHVGFTSKVSDYLVVHMGPGGEPSCLFFAQHVHLPRSDHKEKLCTNFNQTDVNLLISKTYFGPCE